VVRAKIFPSKCVANQRARSSSEYPIPTAASASQGCFPPRTKSRLHQTRAGEDGTSESSWLEISKEEKEMIVYSPLILNESIPVLVYKSPLANAKFSG
jgi:hypothetical protein